MTDIRLYIDHDVSQTKLIKALRESSFDVVTTHDIGNERHTDPEQLVWATQEGRVIYTGNTRDFCKINNNWMELGKEHAGIIVVRRNRYTIGQQLQGIQNLAQQLSAKDMINRCEFLSAWISR